MQKNLGNVEYVHYLAAVKLGLLEISETCLEIVPNRATYNINSQLLCPKIKWSVTFLSLDVWLPKLVVIKFSDTTAVHVLGHVPTQLIESSRSCVSSKSDVKSTLNWDLLYLCHLHNCLKKFNLKDTKKACYSLTRLVKMLKKGKKQLSPKSDHMACK